MCNPLKVNYNSILELKLLEIPLGVSIKQNLEEINNIKKPHHKLEKYLKNSNQTPTFVYLLFHCWYSTKPAVLKLSLSNLKHSQTMDLQQNE